MRCRRFWMIAVMGVLCASGLIAQQTEIAPRIADPVEETSLVSFAGDVPSLARAEFDRGEAAPATRMTHVRLVLARSSEQQAALDKYDAELLDKSSPNYHQWLTPEQFGRRYGPADSDVAAIVAWLQSHGLELDQADPGRTNITFSGTVAQIEGALHTPIHSYEARGEAFLSNNNNPSIPAALAPVVSGVAGLNTIKPRALSVAARPGTFDPVAGRVKPAADNELVGPHPEYTLGSGTSSSPYVFLVVPGDAATIYNTPNTFNANFSSGGTAYKGTGVVIGIAGDAVINANTVVLYRSRFLNDVTQPTITNVDGVTSTTDTDEAYLDTEISGGLAPGATIHFYTATQLPTAIQQMLNDNAVDIISLSFGFCEMNLGTSMNSLINGWWQQAASQGIPVTVATGDSGSAGCDLPDTSKTQVALSGLQVSGYASTAYNIAVGGTDFAGLATNFGTYANPTSSDSASTFYRTATKYIPESTWNDSVGTNGTVAQNSPYHDMSTGFTNIVSGGGGKSSCEVSTISGSTTTCTAGYGKPTWQRGIGVPTDGVRDVPDVSLMAGDGVDFAAWLACTDDKVTTAGSTYPEDCSTITVNGQTTFAWAAFGGTSASAPAFAGILALVQEKTAGGKTGTSARLGQAAKDLYDLYNGGHSPAIFHDVTVGNNSVPCASGTPDCKADAASQLFLTGYDTNAGYDLATGLGSIDATQLITYWGSAIGTAAPSVTVTPASSNVNSSASLNVTVMVSGASGTPSGTVTLSGGGYTATAQTLDSTGTFVFAIPAFSFTTGGAVTLTANYSGDPTYAIGSGTAEINVILTTFKIFASNVTLTAGATSGNTSAITVTPAGGYTGTLLLTATVTSSPSGAVSPPTLAGDFVTITNAMPQQGLIRVTTTVASLVKAPLYRGGNWFAAAGGTALASLLFLFVPLGSRCGRRALSRLMVVVAAAFTVVGCADGGGGGGHTMTTPAVTVTPSKTSFSSTTAITATVTVSGGTQTPTGTVSLAGGGFTASATSLSSGSATINIPANSLSVGSDTLTASYSGDTNFNSANGSAVVTVNKPGTTPGAYTITVTGTDTVHSNVTATNTFTLTVQ